MNKLHFFKKIEKYKSINLYLFITINTQTHKHTKHKTPTYKTIMNKQLKKGLMVIGGISFLNYHLFTKNNYFKRKYYSTISPIDFEKYFEKYNNYYFYEHDLIRKYRYSIDALKNDIRKNIKNSNNPCIIISYNELDIDVCHFKRLCDIIACIETSGEIEKKYDDKTVYFRELFEYFCDDTIRIFKPTTPLLLKIYIGMVDAIWIPINFALLSIYYIFTSPIDAIMICKTKLELRNMVEEVVILHKTTYGHKYSYPYPFFRYRYF